MIRFTPQHPCPICGGHKELPQGQGVRCYGWLSADGWAHCTREELATNLTPDPSGTSWAHRLGGPCKCGVTHEAPAEMPKKPSKDPQWVPVTPVPADAPAPTFRHRDYERHAGVWAYRNHAGEIIGYRVRFNTPDGGKVVLPYTWCEDANEVTNRRPGWHWKDHPKPRPLYGLQSLAEKPDAPVLYVEGEKAADAAAERFPDFAVVSCSGGDNGPRYADFSPLEGRTVIGWPDNDQAGRKYIALSAGPLRLAKATFRVVELPESLPEKWDLADELPSSLTLEDARRLILDAPEYGIEQQAERPAYHLTEGGNAERLVDRFGEGLRYNASFGWLYWDGKRWRQDDGEVPEAAKAIISELYEEAEAAKSEAWKLGSPREDHAKAAHRHADELLKHAKVSDRARAIAGMCEMARTVPLLRSRADEFDGHDPRLPDDHPRRFLLNCANGIIDLRTGQLLEHDRSLMITKLSPVSYDPEAQCPTWERFVSDIMGGDQELVGFLQRAIGYTLTGSCSEQAFFILYGSGSNGKTVFTNILTALLGDYAGETATETLMVSKRDAGAPTEDLARLAGLRLVGANETDEGQRFSEARIKALTGNDPVTARELYKGSFTYRPQFKLWLRTNHKPIIRGNDEGIWRRPRLIPFTQTFSGARKDPNLPAKLLAELPGILAWAVRGCLEWQRIGLGMAAAVEEATNEYRSEMDSLGRFLLDQGVLTPTRAKVLYEAYVEWCESLGEYVMSLTMFGRKLTERGWTTRKDVSGNMVRVPPAPKPLQMAITDSPDSPDSLDGKSYTHTQAQAHTCAGNGFPTQVSGLSGEQASNQVANGHRIVSDSLPSAAYDDAEVI